MPRIAKNTPTVVRKPLEATDHQIGQDHVATMPVTGDAQIDRPDIQVVDGPLWKEKAAALAFAEEMVTVTVHPTSDKFASLIVPIWVNGRVQCFKRGESITVKRKYVEGLARCKPTNYRNEEYVNSDGDKAFRWPSTTGLMYPFQVDRDDNPNGPAWLRKILAEA
jgi:hypothetical protein